MKLTVSSERKSCSNCNAIFLCGATQTDKTCWCMSYPAIMPVDLQQDCLCEKCLSQVVQEKIVNFINTNSLQAIQATVDRYRGDSQLIEGIDYTVENNLYVFTRWHHLKRGSCCENKCKNCPY